MARLFSSSTGVLAFLYAATVHAALCATVVGLGMSLARRAFPTPRVLPALVAVGGAYLVLSFALVEPAELVPIIMAVWCLRAVAAGRRVSGEMAWWPWLLATAIAALQLLIKFNTGIFCVAILTVAAAFMFPREWRLPVVLTAEFVVTLVVLWILTGSTLSALPDFVSHSLELTTGYSAAMAYEEADRRWEYLAALGLSVLTLALVRMAARGTPVRARGAVLVVMILVLYVSFRRGFVRHDVHAVSFFLAGALVPLAIGWSRLAARAAAVAVLIWFVVLTQTSPMPLKIIVDPAPRARALGRQVKTIVRPGARTQVQLAAKADIRDRAALGPATLAELKDRSVHVDPWETAVIWAHGFDWRPPPFFQDYLAYTPELDQVNADALAGARGPERVLREVPPPVIDGRHRGVEAPRSELALVCNYYESFVEGHWEVLRKGPDRCLAARPISKEVLDSGEAVAMPRVGDNELLVMHLALGSSLPQKLKATLFKPDGPSYVIFDGSAYRMVVANAGGPLLPCLPPATGYSPPVSSPCPSTLEVIHDGAITVEFLAVPLRPTAT